VTKLEIRPLAAGDELDAQRRLGEQAFGAMPPGSKDGWLRRAAPTVAAGRYLAAFDGARQVGGALYFDMRQWWAGRDLPMAGVAGVKVAPEARGQGLGRQLMAEVLRQVAGRGYPLSALYPATMPIYRSLGWELAGGRYHVIIPSRSQRSLAPPDAALADEAAGEAAEDGPAPGGLRAAGPGDAAAVIAVLGRAHQAAVECGPITRDLAAVEEWLTHGGEYQYIGDDAFLSYEWQHGNEGLFASCAVAGSAASQRALWSLLAGHSSTADAVEVRVSPDSPVRWLLRERDARLVKNSMWMLRVVNAKAAVEGRGFPAGVHVSARLNIVDGALAENVGTWRLTVADGTAALDRTADGPATLTLGPRGLAALYAGTAVSTLRLAGLAAGGTGNDDAALSAAFTGKAFMLDDF
jgi:predicted acetyltransferase